MSRRRLTEPAAAMTFATFARRIGVKLTPAQRVLCAVAFDGADPIDLDPDDRELARQLFGSVDRFPESARDVVACIAGGRAGKTYVLVALRCLHLALTCDLSQLAPGEHAFGAIVAPDVRLAKQALRFVTGAAKKVPSIARRIERDTAEELSIVRPDGQHVTVECLPATRGGSAVRARSYFFVGLDEAAFFYGDDGYTITDEAIFSAAAPRVMPGGQLVMVSTPYLESGVLFEHFIRNHPNPAVAIDGETRKGEPTDAIAIHAPTLLLNDRPKIRRAVEREYGRDPDRAAREFGGRFVARGTSRFFDPGAIKAASVDRPADLEPRPELPAFAAIDPAFTRDASAMVVLRYEGEKIRVATIVERRPESGKPLKPSVVIGELCDIAIMHGVTTLWSDCHYAETVREVAEARGLAVRSPPGGQFGKAIMFQRARAGINEGRIELSAHHGALVGQLAEVLGRAMPGGGFSVTSPRRKGSHGDIASAFALASWVAEETRRLASYGKGGGRVMILTGEGKAFDSDDDEPDDETPTDSEQGRRFWSGEDPDRVEPPADDPDLAEALASGRARFLRLDGDD